MCLEVEDVARCGGQRHRGAGGAVNNVRGVVTDAEFNHSIGGAVNDVPSWYRSDVRLIANLKQGDGNDMGDILCNFEEQMRNLKGQEPVDNTTHGFKPSIDAVSRGQIGVKGIRLPMRDNRFNRAGDGVDPQDVALSSTKTNSDNHKYGPSVTNDVIAELFGVLLKTCKDIDDFTKGLELGKYAVWSELSRDKRKEVLDTICNMWDALVAEKPNVMNDNFSDSGRDQGLGWSSVCEAAEVLASSVLQRVRL
ncbi:hypothetical protein Tco_1076411 [Tanacetum coccineum]